MSPNFGRRRFLQRNRARRYGLLDEMENPDTENVALMLAANQEISQWMDSQF